MKYFDSIDIKMKYRDIIGIQKGKVGASVILHAECVAWTAGHETGVFDVDAVIHEATTSVWLFPKYFEKFGYNPFTHKFSLGKEGWELIEVAEGIPDLENTFYNFNPFCPYDKKYTGGHFATCKFPQNYSKHPCGRCANTVIVEGRRLEMGIQA